MSKSKIRPSIYIGLGGTGIKAISQTKKLFEEAFGKNNIPSQIAFAAIDFDLSEDPNLPTSMHEDFLTVNNAGSPRTLYEVRRKIGDYQWMFPGNSRYVGTLISDGASQVRTYGRFLTEMIIANIRRRIADCYTQVTNIQADDVDVDNTSSVDIHIAMSLAGGTGSGSFLNVAAMLRDEYKEKIKIIGYGVLHGVFRTMDPSTNKTPRVVANAYSAILDLDYMMQASDDKPVSLFLNGKTTEYRQPIYDEFFVIDNETEKGKRVDNIASLCEVIGTCMFVAGSELGSKIQSGQSNTCWKNGNFNISPKVGWTQGLGACQVVYKGKLLAEIYGLKAALELIRKMQSVSQDIQQKAQIWTEQARIREDGDEYNMLIDAIYAPEKILRTKGTILDPKDSMAEVKTAVANNIERLPDDFPTDKTNSQRVDSIIGNLKDTISDMLKCESGVGNVEAFLQSLKAICEKYKDEMEQERSSKDKEAASLVENLETKIFRQYEEYREKMFSTRKGKQERLDNIERTTKKIKMLKLESKRRAVAYDTFSSILAAIDALSVRVSALKQTLTSLKNSYALELADKQNTSKNNLVFEYDLSYNERMNMAFNPEDSDMNVSEFTSKNSLYDIELSAIGAAIRTYTSGLKQAEIYRNKLIVDVIENLPEDDYKKLKKEITEKSSRLLKLNDRGQVSTTRGNQLPTSMLVQNFLISVYDRSMLGGSVKSRLESDVEFLRDIKKEYIHSDFESMKQKIIFYRTDMAVIPYCIDAFDELTIENEYNTLLRDSMQSGSTGFNPHFDRQVFEEMRKTDFKLKPEMQNEAMFYWVCGNLFGWKEITEDMHIMEKDRDGAPLRCTGKEEVTHPKYIRIKAGKYMYWDENGTSGKDLKWKNMDNLSQRDQAYIFFKTMIFPEFKSVFHQKIAKDITEKGVQYYEAKIENIKRNGIHDYINCLVCSNKNSSTLSSQNSAEWSQYIAEWNFIEKDLINNMQNLKA